MNSRILRTVGAKTLTKYEKLSNLLKYIFQDICKIDTKKHYILGSFSLRKYRNINDLDINIDSLEFMKLEKAIQKGFGRLEFYNGQIRWFMDLTDEYNQLNSTSEKDFSIEAFMKSPNVGFPNNDFSLNNLKQHKGFDIDRNGHQYFSLKQLLKWKGTMNRPKDQSDIIILKQLLK